MPSHRIRALACVALTALLVCGCGRGAVNEGKHDDGCRRERNAGFVGPLEDDSSEDIVSWVDGQVVTDWTAEIAKRDRAIEGYLNDADPGRAEKYGFRSGQNPQLAWGWFRDYPVGFNGVPFVLFKTILDLDPDSRRTRHCGRSPESGSGRRPLPLGSGSSATTWTFDHIGVGPSPID